MNAFVEIYKITLEFFGKISAPLVILILALVYKENIESIFEGLRLSQVDTPVFSAKFEDIIEGLAEAEPDSEQEQQVVRKIEAQEEIVKAEIDSGIRRQIPVQAVSVPPSARVKRPITDPSWTQVLDISWVKPNDLFGRTYFLELKNALYIWPVRLDVVSKRAMFVINTSKDSRKSGRVIAKNIWINEGESYEFSYKRKKYRLNLIDIKRAGKIPSAAAYVSVDKK